MSFFDKIKQGLAKTRAAIGGPSGTLFARIDDSFYDELEEALILADMGVDTAVAAVEALRDKVREDRLRDPDAVRAALRDILAEFLTPQRPALSPDGKPAAILFVGVNGVGKTTTIGKLACRYVREGKRVLLAAGDTFRAAAADQLAVWAQRAGAELIRQSEGADPAAVVFDAASAAKARGADLILADTAGRLHNKQNLMNELSKIGRVLTRELPDVPRRTYLVLDATTGQNGLSQAREFCKAAEVSGVILTKLDGTAKGGIVVAIAHELGLPVEFIGVGEGIDDLMPFDPRAFAAALLSMEDEAEIGQVTT